MQAAEKTPPGKSSLLGAGCFVLFALPFLFFGSFAILEGLRQPSASGAQHWVPVIVGGVFCSFAIGLMAAAFFAQRSAAETAALKQQHPDQPWLWQADWKNGRINGSGRTVMYATWGFAAFWNAISFPSALAARDELLAGDKPELYFILLFPTIGIGLLIWAVVTTLRYRKFGTAYLQLATLPASIGGRLAGRIETNIREIPANGCFLALAALERTRRGKNTSEKTLWQDERLISPQGMGRGPDGIFIPIEFRIPADCQPTSVDGGRRRIIWRLTGSIDLPGVDFESSFDVPVFQTRDPSAATAFLSNDFDEEPDFATASTPIWIDGITPQGNVEFYFPPARDVSGAVSLTFFTLLWGASLAALIKFDAPILFPILWGLFEVLLIWGTLEKWTGTTRVVVEARELSIRHTTLGLGGQKRLPYSNIADLRVQLTAAGLQHARGKADYRVEAMDRSGRKTSVIRNIKGKMQARAFARRLNEEVSRRSGLDFRTGEGKV